MVRRSGRKSFSAYQQCVEFPALDLADYTEIARVLREVLGRGNQPVVVITAA